MKFGVSTFVTDEGISPVALGPALEERGFDSLFLAEHTHIPTSRETPYYGGGDLPRIYYRTLDPFLTLAAIAPVTTNLLLGTGIAQLTHRDPIITAKEVATLDLISGGRALLGVAAGWVMEEMRNHGTDPHTRGRLLDERMRAIVELWTKDEAEFHGDLVNIERSFSWPKPVQKPYPPVLVGGDNPRVFPRIKEYGAGWLTVGIPPEALAPMIARMRDEAGPDKLVWLYGAPHDPETVEKYIEIGVDRIALYLPTRPEAETLRTLDEFSKVASAFR
jgi:probable F420-dependent oxidoreductase